MTYEKFCNEILPSGSGFNCNWEHVKTQKNGSEVFETYYHNMSELGYYDGFTKIRLVVPAVLGDFRVTLSEGKRKYMDWNYRDYINDTIWHALEGKAFTFVD